MKISFIGIGVMGEAIVNGLVAQKVVSPQDITACDVKASRLEEMRSRYGLNVAQTRRDAIATADIIVLAVKPQDMGDVLSDLYGRIPSSALVLSIAAGITVDSLRQGLSHVSIVRSMPNMPAQVGEGITVWTATDETSEGQRVAARSVLGALGKEVYVAREDYLDMATALSGSGPGFVFLFIEALTDAGVHIGMPRDLAERLVLETVAGSAHAVTKMGKHPAMLKNMVTSPGGTTAEGLREFERGGLRYLAVQAVVAAYDKAKALGAKK